MSDNASHLRVAVLGGLVAGDPITLLALVLTMGDVSGFLTGKQVATYLRWSLGNHHQGLLDQNAIRQFGHAFFASQKSCIDFSFCEAVRKQRRVLT